MSFSFIDCCFYLEFFFFFLVTNECLLNILLFVEEHLDKRLKNISMGTRSLNSSVMLFLFSQYAISVLKDCGEKLKIKELFREIYC